MSNRLHQARGLSKKPLTLCEYLAACGGIRLYRRSGQRESYRGELLARIGG